MKAFRKIISLFAATSIVASGMVLPASARTETDVDVQTTPLTIFKDTFENRTNDEVSLFSSGLNDDVWEVSQGLSASSAPEQYSIVTEEDNSMLSLTPYSADGQELCVLNMKDTINFLGDYVLKVDISTEFATADSVSGIRISHPYDDTSYYELSLISNLGLAKPRFIKVEDAIPDTIATADQWKYSDEGTEKDVSEYEWLTLSLAKRDNTVFWSVTDKESGETLWISSFDDANPVFADMGRLQLFAYSTDENSAPVLFDNVNATLLGAKFYKDENGEVKVEAAWVNDSNNPPLIAVADYDENGRLIDTQLLTAEDGYYLSNEGITLSGAETKLFVWDGETNQPIYDVAVYTDPDVYIASADEYVPQAYRGVSSFENGNGIKFGMDSPVRVSTSAELFINGFYCPGYNQMQTTDKYGNWITVDCISNEQLDKYLGNAQGNIKFERTDRTSREYDRIYVDYYEVGKVTAVSYRYGKTTVKVSVADNSPYTPSLRFPPSCTIEIDDEEVQAGYVELYVERNKKAIELKDLQKGDAIAFAVDNIDTYYSGAYSTTIVNPYYMKVLATDKTITGMVTDYDDDYGTYTIDNTPYKYVGYTGYELQVATTYELTLDPFGRILDEGVAVSTGAKFAIVEKFDSNTDQVTMLLADGTTANYEIHSGSYISASQIQNFLYYTDYYSGKTLNPVQNRVVTYTISGGAVKMQAAPFVQPISGKEYNANTNKIGSVAVTKYLNVINATNYVEEYYPSISDYEVFDTNNFKAGVEYDGYAYKSGDTYSFMIITSTGATFTEDSRFAVITKDPRNVLYDGSTCMGAEALYNGEAITLYSDSGRLSGCSEGDVVYFTTDRDGYIKSIHKIYDRDTNTNTAPAAFASLPVGVYKAADWNFSFAQSTGKIQLVSGYVTDVKNNVITLGVVNDSSDYLTGEVYNNVINGNIYNSIDGMEGMFTFDIADDCQAYIFDETLEVAQNSKKYSIVDAQSIIESQLTEVTDSYGEAVDYMYSATNSVLNSAIALIVDGEVVEIFVNQKNSEKPSDDSSDIEAPTEKFAIVEKYNTNTDQVTMLLADGTTATYEIHANSIITAGQIQDFIYSSGRTLRPVQDRVVTYMVSGDAVKLASAYNYVPLMGSEYNAHINRVGSVAITEHLDIINATYHEESASPSISDYEVFDANTFKKGVEYDGFAFKSGDVYAFMIITRAGTTFTEESRFAVITRDPRTVIFDGFACIGAEALYNGEAITLYSDSGMLYSVGEGDVVFFTTDKYGYVKSLHKIYNRNNDYNMAAQAFASMPAGAYKPMDWNFSFAESMAKIQLVSGYVTEVKNKSITLGVVSDDPSYGPIIDGNMYERPDGSAGMFTFGIADDCQTYVFDSQYPANQLFKKYAIVDASSIVESTLVEAVDEYGCTLDYVYDVPSSYLHSAMAMVVNGEVVCILVNYPY